MLAGIRGAIIAKRNSRQAILEATTELLESVIGANEITQDQVAGVFLTATPDLDADFPAYALREMGWTQAPALCAQEIAVPGAMERVIRIMIFVNQSTQRKVQHQYIREARALRPDLADDDTNTTGSATPVRSNDE